MMRGSLKRLASKSLSFAGKWQQQPLRRLDIHEFQGAELMSKYGVDVPKGLAISSVDEVQRPVKDTFPGKDEVVVKSQGLAGGQGLGMFRSGLISGVHILKADQLADISGKMFGHTLVTRQTVSQGNPYNKVSLKVPSFVRLGHTYVDQGKESGETSVRAQDTENRRENVLRPLSPHLPIYKPQLASTLSISNRISAVILTAYIVSFHLLTMKTGLICLSYEKFYQVMFYSSKLFLISSEIAGLALAYHVYHGIHHLWMDFSGKLPNKSGGKS